jgi:signal recognition particle receptor subunit beta
MDSTTAIAWAVSLLVAILSVIGYIYYPLSTRNTKTLILGTQHSGKTKLFTTLLNRSLETTTSIAINENADYIDVPGHHKLRHLHLQHLSSRTIIFCIDSTTIAKSSIHESEYLMQILSSPQVASRKCKFLILCTKASSILAVSTLKIKTMLESQMYSGVISVTD